MICNNYVAFVVYASQKTMTEKDSIDSSEVPELDTTLVPESESLELSKVRDHYNKEEVSLLKRGRLGREVVKDDARAFLLPGDLISMNYRDMEAFTCEVEGKTYTYEGLCELLGIAYGPRLRRISRFYVCQKLWPIYGLKEEQFSQKTDHQEKYEQKIAITSMKGAFDVPEGYEASAINFLEKLLQRDFGDFGAMPIKPEKFPALYRLRNIADMIAGTDPIDMPYPHMHTDVSLENIERVINAAWNLGEPMLIDGEHILRVYLRKHTAKFLEEIAASPTAFLNEFLKDTVPKMRGYTMTFIASMHGYSKPLVHGSELMPFLAHMFPENAVVQELLLYMKNNQSLLKDYIAGKAPAGQLTAQAVARLMGLRRINGVPESVLRPRLFEEARKLQVL